MMSTFDDEDFNREYDSLSNDESIDSHTKAQLFGRLYVCRDLQSESLNIYSIATGIALWCFGQKLSGRVFATFFHPDENEELKNRIFSSVSITKKAQIPFYNDPIHSAASTLGKLGGQSKSPAKSISSRENGKKGGRPKGKKDKKNTIDLDIFE